MRRPAAACAAGFTAGIAAYDAAGTISFSVLSVGFLLFYLIVICNKIEIIEKNVCCLDTGIRWMRQRELKCAILVFLVFFAAGGMRYAVFFHSSSDFSDLIGKNVSVSGRVISVQQKEEKLLLIVRAERENRLFGEKLMVTVKQKQKESGERSGSVLSQEAGRDYTGWRIRASGVMTEPQKAGNPKAFDYRKYLASRGIRLLLYADESGLSEENAPSGVYRFFSALAAVKTIYISAVSSHIDEPAAGLLSGIMFGERSDLDESVYEEFQKNGTAHLLAVSGLHISMIYGILYAVFRRPATYRGNLPIAAILVIYAALSGFSPSVVRAVFMIIVHMAAKVSHRRYDFLSCISFCAFVLLLYRPAMLFSAGFQLSFLAVLTISIVMPHADFFSGVSMIRAGMDEKSAESGTAQRRFIAGRMRAVRIQAAGMILMQAGMMPMTLYHFHYISIAALFLNPLAIALAGVIVPAGVALLPLSLALKVSVFCTVPDAVQSAGECIFSLLCRITQMLLELLIGINDFAAETPLSYRYLASPPDGFFLFYYAALFFFCSETGHEFLVSARAKGMFSAVKKTVCLAVAAAILCGAAGFYTQRTMITSDLIFVDVGQGDCAHLKADRGVDLMFDSGGSDSYDVGKNVLIPYFLANGVSEIDLAVISHLHQDHCGGLETMTQGVKVKQIMLSAVYRSQAAQISERFGVSEHRLLFVKAGDVVTAGGVTLTVLAPEAASDDEYRRTLEENQDENELCLVVKAEYKETSVLFTGDIGSDCEERLAEQWNGSAAGDSAASVLRSDILKAAHHGSKYSTCDAFVSAVLPRAAVIQVGTNFYGHPSEEVIERLQRSGTAVYRNDEDGAVFFSMGKRFRVSVMRKNE